MKFKILENCLRIMSYWVDEDERVIKKLLDYKEDFRIPFQTPFRKELNLNLLEIHTNDGKKDLLKHYIYEFWELQGFFINNQELLYNTTKRGIGREVFFNYSKENKEQKANQMQCYIFSVQELFDRLFEEIQFSCLKFGFNIFDLCSELNFRTDIFEGSLTLNFEFQTELNLKEKADFLKSKAKTENLFGESDSNLNLTGTEDIINSEKSFVRYFEGPYNEQIADKLRTAYKGKIGRELKIMMNVMQRIEGQGRLIIPNQGFRKFYNAMSEYFGGNIGSYTSINDYKKEIKEDEEKALSLIQKIIDSVNKSQN